MTAVLTLGEGLVLPLEAVTQTTAVVGQRGTGKTSTAVVIVEEAAAAGAQFVVLDPTGAWHGLRSSADGEGPGLQCVIFGGHHGDLPLDPAAGAFLARLVVEQGLSVVLDLELLTKGKQVQLVAEFCETLYHLNRTALTVVVDEAHRFAPQQLRDPGGFGARCLGAVTDVVTLGRRKGLGAVLISQRPAKLNKDVLEQAEILIAHRLKGPNDRKAIREWLDELGEDATEALAALPKLPRGTAIVHASELDVDGVFLIREKRTFDSSATPEVGAAAIVPRGRADVDLQAIESAMSETIEAAKADDPKALRARIAELEREVAASGSDQPDDLIGILRGITDAAGAEGAPFLDDAVSSIVANRDHLRVRVEKLERGANRALQRAALAEAALRDVADALQDHAATLHEADALPVEPLPSSVPPGSPARASAAPAATKAPRQRDSDRVAPRGDGVGPEQAGGARETLPPARQRVLDALAWFQALGIEAPKRAALAPMAASKATSGGFKNNLGALRSSGLIDYPEPNRVTLTLEGVKASRTLDLPRTPEALQHAVLAAVAPARARILASLIARHPEAVPRETLAGDVEVPPTSGGFKNNLGALKTAEFITYPAPGMVAAAPLLFGDA